VSALSKAEHYQSHHGWSLLPLHGKQPNHRLIRHTRGTSETGSFWQRPADTDELRAWFKVDPETNIGVACGGVSGGLAVLDQDEGPPAGVRIPATALVETARGFQSYFRANGPAPNRDFSWGELRGEGRYCVLPPSLHPSGVRYRWLLDPETAGIAPFELLVLPSAERSVSRESVPLGVSSVPLGTRTLADWDFDETSVVRMAAALGIHAPFGRAFPCVLHDEQNPSATIWQGPDGWFGYHDFHARGGRSWLPLARVRAALAGRPDARGLELAVWKVRLLVEAGLVDFPSVSVPGGLSGDVALVYGGFLFLLGCREWMAVAGTATTFTRSFGVAWCRLPERRFREAFAELRRLGLVKPVGATGRMPLWLPGGGDAMA
jgi:Bifunctional DNA primase/polymerase, N-terminal